MRPQVFKYLSRYPHELASALAHTVYNKCCYQARLLEVPPSLSTKCQEQNWIRQEQKTGGRKSNSEPWPTEACTFVEQPNDIDAMHGGKSCSMLQQPVTRAPRRNKIYSWASVSSGALSLSGGSMQALKECPAHMCFLNRSCACSDAGSQPTYLCILAPLYLLCTPLTFQHMSARLYAIQLSDPRPRVKTCCCACLLRPGIWHGKLGACDRGRPLAMSGVGGCSTAAAAPALFVMHRVGCPTLQCRAHRPELCLY